MKSFQSRNPVPIGVVGLVVIALGLLAALNTDKLPIIGAGTIYEAHFAEAAGLIEEDAVRIAGVKVGSVKAVELSGDHVVVRFKVKDAWIGNKTTAAIKIQTLLGSKYLALNPLGNKPLDPSTPIPLSRTTAPYDVTEAFQDLTRTVQDLDTQQLAKSFEVLSETFENTPDEISAALEGLSELSRVIAKRDEQLSKLLANAKQVSHTLAKRDDALVKLIEDANKLLAELKRREQAISTLLEGSRALARQLRGLVRDNQDQISKALEELNQLTSMLYQNQKALAKGIKNYSTFIRLFTNAIGNGRWFDSYICGLLPPSIGPINKKGCYPQ